MGTPSALRAGASGLRKTPRPAASRTLLLVSLQVLLVCTTPRGSAAEVESFAARAACCAADPPGTFRPIINNTFNTAFIIGSQKSGTTWLFTELLSRHPLLRPWRKIYKTIHTHNGLNLQHPAQSELVKEPHYFDTLPAKSFDDYLAGFSAEKKLRKNRTATFIDATPDYLHIPAAACRLSAAFPKARLLLVLRDPVRRAFSAHNMMKLEAANTKFPMGKFGAEVASEHAALWAKGCSYEDVREGASGGTSAGGGGASGGGGGGRGGDGGGGGAPRLLQGSANETAAAGRGGARSAAGRASAARGAPSPALGNHPSWNDCFRCSFTYCGTYAGAMPMPLPVAGAAGEGRRDAVKGGCSFKDMPRAGLVRRGLYAYQLHWWLQFFPADQIMVVNHARMQAKPEEVLDEIIKFFGQDVSKKLPKPTKTRNMGFKLPQPGGDGLKGKQREALDGLYKYFEGPNRALYALINSTGIRGWHADHGFGHEFPRSHEEHLRRKPAEKPEGSGQ